MNTGILRTADDDTLISGNEEKQVVYVLSDGHSSCVFDERERFMGEIEAILDNADMNDSCVGEKWIISTALMTEKEIEDMEEFSGF